MSNRKSSKKLSKQSAWTQDSEDEGMQLHSLSPVQKVYSEEEDDETAIAVPAPTHHAPTNRRYRRRNAQNSVPENGNSVGEQSPGRPVSRVSWRDLDEEIQPSPSHSSEGRSRNGSPPTETSQSREASLGSRRDVLSGDGSRSQTPLSDTKSYRDRLRDRFQAVKERAGMSSRTRLREQRLHTPLSSRVDELLRKEEEDVEAALAKHEKLRIQWRDAADKSACQGENQDEAYDFFTRVWDGNGDEKDEQVGGVIQQQEEQVIQPAPAGPTSPEEEEVTGERVKLLTADLLGLRDEWELFEFVPPECTDWKDLRSKEHQLLFYPSTKPVRLEEKIKPGHEVRYLEDEGLYIGKQPWVSYRNRNKMERRLLAEGNMEWFGDDGEIVTLPDPRSKSFYSNAFIREVDGDFPDLEYLPAVITDSTSHGIIDSKLIGNYILEVEICSICFTHHPLFSREHVLAQKLTEKYSVYVKCASQDTVERLSGKLTALRTARDNLRSILQHSEQCREDQVERLQKYEEEIKETKKLRLSESRSERQLLGDILSLWRELKRLREQQGFTSTPVKLLIHKDPDTNPDEEREAWNKMIQSEIDELEEELETEYKEKFDEYVRQLAVWKKNQKKKKSSKYARSGGGDDTDEDDEDIHEIEDETEEESEEVTVADEKPKPPEKLNSDMLRTELIQTLTESFRPPGEPKIHLEVVYNSAIDQNPLLNKEKIRRLAVQKCNVFVKLFYNKKEVCRSYIRPVGHRFIVSVAQMFPICIMQQPDELKIEIYEHSGTLSQHLISEVFLPIPSSTTTRQNCEVARYEFSSDQVISSNHAGVGSGVYFSLFPDDSSSSRDMCLFTSGCVTCRIGWGMDSSGKILSPPEKYLNRLNEENMITLDVDEAVDIEKLKAWAEKMHLDPNDPNNAPIFNFIQNASVSMYTEPDYFRLDPLQQEFDFCTMEDLDNNPRLRLLHLRDQGEPEFRGMRMIPIREKEISKDVFKLYEKRLAAPSVPPDTLASDPLDSQRSWGQRFLQDVRQKILKQCRLAQQQRHLHDIIIEDQVPDIGTLGLTFLKWLKPKRPLRPVRKERKRVAVQNLGGQEVKIIVNVVNAFNVPIRKDVDTVNTVVGPHGYKFAMVPVRPFVEVSFRGFVARTTVTEGSNPTWNQELQIPLQPPNEDFSPGNLQSLQDILYIHLFDEIVVDILEDERARETTIHNRLERHWLGSFQIPFSTLYFNSRIEGTFQLYCPPILLGYERELQQKHFAGLGGSFEQQANSQRDSTFLTVFITVQPALNPPEPFKERLESSEPEYLEQHLDAWEKEVAKLVPHRKMKTLVLDVSGKSVCVTKFIHPLAPPVLAEEGQVTTEKMVARFVSMIPVVPGSVLFPGLFDIWLTSDQVLNLLTGDSDDLAVLLCCYFLHMGKQAWVLLGSGIPHGPTAYVLTREEEHTNVFTYYLWDPVSGRVYEMWDSFCPLLSVYCLINDTNIWANIQGEEIPRRTRYDVKKRSDWLPAFERVSLAPSGSVQPSSLDYVITSSNVCQLLRDKIEKTLRDNLMKWRRTTRTQWNRYCIAILRKLLPTLERAAWGIDDSAGQHHMQELQHVSASHKICGFPINLPYSNMETITEAMKATGVHLNEDPHVEFALAVYVHPYPNNIISVWVYVASLLRRR